MFVNDSCIMVIFLLGGTYWYRLYDVDIPALPSGSIITSVYEVEIVDEKPTNNYLELWSSKLFDKDQINKFDLIKLEKPFEVELQAIGGLRDNKEITLEALGLSMYKILMNISNN